MKERDIGPPLLTKMNWRRCSRNQRTEGDVFVRYKYNGESGDARGQRISRIYYLFITGCFGLYQKDVNEYID